MPERPTSDDVAAARSLVVDELLGDFPCIGDAERAHAVALLLLPFARDLIAGPTPLHLLEKPTPGTGATLLADMLALPAIGRPIPAMVAPRDDEEWRKLITSKLRVGSPYMFADNLKHRLDSAALAGALTATAWEDRILGVSDVARLPVRCIWLATGNNPAVSNEIARRTVRVRLDSRTDQPHLRSGFRHPKLRQWAAENRGRLVWAALTLIRAWIVAGRPAAAVQLGMYEDWAETMGGILEVAGVPGFLENLQDFYADSDAEGAEWRGFLGAWWTKFGQTSTTVKQLWPVAAEDGSLSLGTGSAQSQIVTLGKVLTERRDRVFDLDDRRLMLRRSSKPRQGSYQWSLAIAV
ncbi:MAG: hypothetical protein IT424_05950 [Pirellulales bacterium]|nr:hypothetical protein [Pirellulales bacterium]